MIALWDVFALLTILHIPEIAVKGDVSGDHAIGASGRYYEMMYALITSRLFDGVSGFDNIHHMQMKPGYSLQHTYNKLAMLLALQRMYCGG